MFTLLKLLKSSTASEGAVPTPPDPYVTWPGLDLASAMNSLNVLAATPGWTTRIWSVARICLAVGIQSQGTFTTSFGKHFGVTPIEYRAQLRPAAALAVVPMCVTRVYGRPRYRTIREDRSAADQ